MLKILTKTGTIFLLFLLVCIQGSIAAQNKPASSLVSQNNTSVKATEIKPTDKAFQDLQKFTRYGCAALPNQPISRTDFAQKIILCRTNLTAYLKANPSNAFSNEEKLIWQNLQQEFAPELTAFDEEQRIRNRPVDSTVMPPPAPQAMPIPATKPLSERNLNGYYTGMGTVGRVQAGENGEFNREGYNVINENAFHRVKTNPLSTFSIDVDTASYSNVRRFINNGQKPPKDAVRLEELLNYFTYNYPEPDDNKPFSITTEVAQAPWNPKHQLVQVGLQAKRIATQDLPPSNLVFLIDVSGSMDEPNKLPLVKDSLRLLVKELRENDKVSIVVYAGAAGVVLPPTPGNQKDKIMGAIEELKAGGSTAGGQGIELAYKLAQENFISSGNNRVILATDGDFNVGISSDAELVRLIEQKRQSGVFLSVFGFGTGNYQDAKMEQLANKGNGNYAYVDSLLEAKKIFVQQIGATLLTIAKDVKIQVEFNPAKVQAYRLIGYENRLLEAEDFNNDKKDAGELGAGHSVTALYEIIPVGVESDVKIPEVDPLRYQPTAPIPGEPVAQNDELMLVKLRYKAPTGNVSQLIFQPVTQAQVNDNNLSENLKFAAAVASFGMILRDSEYKGTATVEQVLQMATQAKGEDTQGYRSEFIRLVEKYRSMPVSQK